MNKDKVAFTEKRSITSGAIWDKAYSLDNYEIEYTYNKIGVQSNTKVCAVYFSSSGIYYPNTDEQLKKSIIIENRYEWKKHRIRKACKHIFVRDIAKNFYVIGINKTINSIDVLMDFLKQETNGYEIITVGSSGGAYMAALAGAVLEANVCYTFSCFWNLNRIDYDVWNLVSMYKDDSSRSKYYDISHVFDESCTKVIYVYPALNIDEVNNDHIQCQYVIGNNKIISIPIKSKIHGGCMNDYLLDEFINMPVDKFQTLHITGMISEMRLAINVLSSRKLFQMFRWMIMKKIRKYIKVLS